MKTINTLQAKKTQDAIRQADPHANKALALAQQLPVVLLLECRYPNMRQGIHITVIPQFQSPDHSVGVDPVRFHLLLAARNFQAGRIANHDLVAVPAMKNPRRPEALEAGLVGQQSTRQDPVIPLEKRTLLFDPGGQTVRIASLESKLARFPPGTKGC